MVASFQLRPHTGKDESDLFCTTRLPFDGEDPVLAEACHRIYKRGSEAYAITIQKVAP